MQRQVEQLSKLSGAEFEKMFMRMMSEHHATAAVDAVECLLKAYHPEMLNMCAMMLGAQGDEIAQMRVWLCQWYAVCSLENNHRHHRH